LFHDLFSREYALHLVERHFLGAPIVKLRRAGAGMVRHLRGLLKRPAVLEIRGNARSPKRVIADLGRISAARARRWIIP